MSESTTPRPTQVTVAAWLVMSGSVFVVLTAFDQVAGLRSMETREAVEEFLSRPPGDGLGVGVQGMLSLMRVLTMVAAACATAAAILGFQVLRRSRSARLVLTVLAVPLFVTGVAVGGLVPAIIVGSITMLWFQPARDWIDGKAPRAVAAPPTAPHASPPQAPHLGAPPPGPPTPTHQPPAPPAAPTQARPYSGFGEAPVPPPEAWPATPPPYAGAPAGPARPHALTWACALTWAGCAVAVMVMLASMLVMLAAPETLLDELYRQNPELRADGVTESTLRSTVLLVGILVVAWSVVASLLAAFAWRGRSWAWTALLVSASCASLLCLLAALGSPAMLVPLALCGVTVPMLLRPEVRAFVRRSALTR